MNDAVAIANGPGRSLPDDQRKAMFARMGRGGGSGRGPGSRSPGQGYTPNTTMRDRFNIVRAAYDGYREGSRGGVLNTLDVLTGGWIPSLSRAAEHYTGSAYDVSRGAATVAREALLSAAGIGVAGRVGAAWRHGSYVPALAKNHIRPFLAVGGFGGQQALEQYRTSNPIRHYHEDKALAMGSQLLGYVGAIGAFGSVMQYGGAMARTAIPLTGGRSVAGGYRHALDGLDRAFRATGSTLGKTLPDSWGPALSRAAAGQRWLSAFTGSTLKDLPRVRRVPGDLKKAKGLTARAADYRAQAARIREAANRLEPQIKRQYPSDIWSGLRTSHNQSMQRAAEARETYRTARDQYYAIERAASGSRMTSSQMLQRAAKLEDRARTLTHDSYTRLGKAALVSGGIVGTEIYDEHKIRQAYPDYYAAHRDGASIPLSHDTPRGPLGTFAQTMVGFNLNNPGEKQFRPGRARWQTQTANYRAGYDAIMEDYAAGHMTATQRDDELHRFAARAKPWNMQGRGLWTESPAMAAYGDWKIREVLDKAGRSTVAPVTRVVDGDTVWVDHSFPGQTDHWTGDKSGQIRYLDLDAPEMDWSGAGEHEPYAERATHRMKELLAQGQYARLVEDSHDRASGLGTYGRQLGRVETLPRPFDQLLRIPYLGRALPARDTGKTLIEEGLSVPGYRHLSGRTDTGMDYDDAFLRSVEAGRGLHSPEGLQAQLEHWGDTDYTHAHQTIAERSDQWFQRRTGEERPAETFWDKALTPAAIGLMTTGNTGIFRDLTRSGPGISQLYNLSVAYLGAKNYNTRAARTAPSTAPRANVRHALQDERDRLLREARQRARAQAH